MRGVKCNLTMITKKEGGTKPLSLQSQQPQPPPATTTFRESHQLQPIPSETDWPTNTSVLYFGNHNNHNHLRQPRFCIRPRRSNSKLRRRMRYCNSIINYYINIQTVWIIVVLASPSLLCFLILLASRSSSLAHYCEFL